MDRDDYISKLFIKNQDKLNEAPSPDFWSKLEAQLDEKMPVKETGVQKSEPKIIPLSRYAAAASVLVAVFALVYWIQFSSPATTGEIAIVLQDPTIIPINDEESYDVDVLPTNASAIEEEKELKEQENKIVNGVNQQVPNAGKIGLDQIALAEQKEKVDEIRIDLESSDDVAANTTVVTTNIGIALGSGVSDNEYVTPQTTMNYANGPQLSNIANNDDYAEQVLKNADVARQENAGDYNNKTTTKESKKINNRGVVPNIADKSKTTKVKSPMATAHARLQPFGFLLGRWVDDNEKEGTSYETWSLKDANTLIGKGYKLATNNERIFEELMRIEFRDGQVFLVMSLAETNGTVDYMMTKYDNEHFVFEQKESNKFPDKVVIQRTLDGYTTIILNNSNFLTSEQQRYLENRNRVSNVRSVRTMRADE